MLLIHVLLNISIRVLPFRFYLLKYILILHPLQIQTHKFLLLHLFFISLHLLALHYIGICLFLASIVLYFLQKIIQLIEHILLRYQLMGLNIQVWDRTKIKFLMLLWLRWKKLSYAGLGSDFLPRVSSWKGVNYFWALESSVVIICIVHWGVENIWDLMVRLFMFGEFVSVFLAFFKYFWMVLGWLLHLLQIIEDEITSIRLKKILYLSWIYFPLLETQISHSLLGKLLL